MSKEIMEQHEYEDTLVDMHSLFVKYGCREVMKNFRNCYPEMFGELNIQINRLVEKQVPALFKEPSAAQNNVGSM